MVDIVYPLREKRPRVDPLRWSLRSLVNLRGVEIDRVIFVGGLPDWVRDGFHIATIQDADPFTNVGRALEAIVRSNVSEDFIWFQDDVFLMEPWEPKVHARLKSLDRYVEVQTAALAKYTSEYNRQYVAGVTRQRDMLRAWGYDTSTLHNGCCHFPLPVNKTRLAEVLERMKAFDPGHPLGHFKAVYAADLDVVRTRDPKIMSGKAKYPGWPVVSTSQASWDGDVGEAVRRRFPEPSPFG